MNRLRTLETRLYDRLLIRRLVLHERLFRHRRSRILFSPMPGWEEQIRAGFGHTNHEIAFRKLSPEVIPAYDLVVPLTIDDLKYLNQVRDLIAGNPLPIPSLESIELCDDKYRFNQMLQDNGFGAFVPQIGGRLAFPYVVKKRIDAYGQSCRIIHDAGDEAACAGILADPEYFTQQLVPGANEYATHILFKDRRIRCWINVEYTFGTATPIKGKDKELVRRACRCPHLALFAEILRTIGFEGLCCFNYKESGRGELMIMENNPRFGGSLTRYFFGFVKYLN
jgi:hypothetical protein